jgi:hypothetical protein
VEVYGCADCRVTGEGQSALGVKMSKRRSELALDSSMSWTKTVSDRLNSLAMRCFWGVDMGVRWNCYYSQRIAEEGG